MKWLQFIAHHVLATAAIIFVMVVVPFVGMLWRSINQPLQDSFSIPFVMSLLLGFSLFGAVLFGLYTSLGQLIGYWWPRGVWLPAGAAGPLLYGGLYFLGSDWLESLSYLVGGVWLLYLLYWVIAAGWPLYHTSWLPVKLFFLFFSHLMASLLTIVLTALGLLLMALAMIVDEDDKGGVLFLPVLLVWLVGLGLCLSLFFGLCTTFFQTLSQRYWWTSFLPLVLTPALAYGGLLFLDVQFPHHQQLILVGMTSFVTVLYCLYWVVAVGFPQITTGIYQYWFSRATIKRDSS